MENLFGILNSQSRYELQQALLFNPNGLVASTTNRFGIVDSSNKISRLDSISNRLLGERFAQSVLTNQPLLSVNEFGTGLHAIDARGSARMKMPGVSGFMPNWDVECFLAFKMKIDQNTGFPHIYTITRNDVSNDALSGMIVQMNAGKILFSFRNFDRTKEHALSSDLQYGDNVEYDIIVYNSGTNDMSNSKIYVDGVEVASTASINDDMTGVDIYPGTGWETSIFTRASDTAQSFQGFIGKLICGYGTPNVSLIIKSLNATTY